MNQTTANHQASDRSKTLVSLALLTLFTLLTFANAWPDAVVFDDAAFAGSKADYRLENLADGFTRGLWDGVGGLYRPLLRIDFELQIRMFGDWLEGYHLMNILLHLATTLVMFGFLRYLLRTLLPAGKNATFYALLAALVFAVHPTHTEVVNSIFNKSGMYVTIAAIGSLWWLHANLENHPVRAWIGYGLIYSAAILFKESALVMPGMAAAMIFLLTDGSVKDRIIRFLPVFFMFIPIIIYFWARAVVLAYAGGDDASGSEELASMFAQTEVMGGSSPLVGIGMFGQGLKILAWPYPSVLYHRYPYPIETVLYIGLQLAVIGWAIYLWTRGKPVLAFALVFYYLALLPSIRLISFDGASPHMSERYLYFPSAGMTVALAFGFRSLAERYGTRFLTLVMMPVLLILAAISWDRNADWGSAIQLFETEYERESSRGSALRILTTHHYFTGNHQRIAEICEENQHRFEEWFSFVTICMGAFINQGRQEDAFAALEVYAEHGSKWISARQQLAKLYAALKRNREAVEQYAKIIDGVDDPAGKDMFKGEMLMVVFPDDPEQLMVARKLQQQALAAKPDLKTPHRNIKQIDEMLAALEQAGEAGKED